MLSIVEVLCQLFDDSSRHTCWISWNWSNQMRRIYYNGMINVESVETQRKGIVVIVWAIGGTGSRRILSASTFWKSAAVQRALPARVVAFHICYDHIILRPIISTMQLGCDFFTGVRFRSHYGTVSISWDSKCRVAIIISHFSYL